MVCSAGQSVDRDRHLGYGAYSESRSGTALIPNHIHREDRYHIFSVKLESQKILTIHLLRQKQNKTTFWTNEEEYGLCSPQRRYLCFVPWGNVRTRREKMEAERWGHNVLFIFSSPTSSFSLLLTELAIPVWKDQPIFVWQGLHKGSTLWKTLQEEHYRPV